MIPTMIVFGVVLGRWWKTTLVTGTLLWPAVLLRTGIITLTAGDLAGAAVFGLANTAVGVALHQGVLHVVRQARATGRTRRITDETGSVRRHPDPEKSPG